MSIKKLVPGTLLLILVAATGYIAGNKGLPDFFNTSSSFIAPLEAKESSGAKQELSGEQLAAKESMLKNVQSLDSSVQDIQIEESPVSGVYWVLLPGNETILMSENGQYILGRGVSEFQSGELKPVESRIAKLALKGAQESVKKDFVSSADTQLIYPAFKEKKAEVYVFTDVKCGYCKKFHREVSQLNAAGIEVRYFAGPFFSRDRTSLEQIWCSADPLKAMTDVKSGKKLDAVTVTPECTAIVSQHIEIGGRLGIRGTPAIYDKNGEKLGGYVPASQLISRLTQ